MTRRDDGRFLELTNGMTYGSSESQGVVRGNSFLHKKLDLYLTFPKGWIIDNRPDSVVARSPRGEQQIIMRMRDLNKRQSAEEFLADNFQAFSDGRSIQTSEEQAYAGKAVIETNNGGKEKVQVAAVYRGKRAFMLYSRGKKALPENEFFATVESVRRLKDKETQRAGATRIELTTARRGDTFAKLAKKSPNAGPYAEQELRLINGMFPNGEPVAGQLIKVLR